MANNKIQFKRTSTSGLLPNTTSSANASFIDAGEFAVNLTDRKVISSNGTATFEVGANVINKNITGNATFATNNTRLNFTANASAAGNLSYFILQSDNNFVFYNTATDGTARAIWSTFTNSNTSAFTLSAPMRLNSALIDGAGSNGINGYVLTSNGTGINWSPAGSFSNGTAYTWSAVQTYNANVAVVGNSTAQLLIGTTTANLIANQSTVILSVNSTANVFANSTSIVVQANATQNAVINATGFYVNGALIGGGSFSNGTAYTWSAVQTFNSNVAIAGNSTSQLLVGTTAANVTANSSSIFVSANSTQNVAINSTAVSIGSSIISSTGSAAGLSVGNTAANVTINTTAIVVQANATQNAVINATGFYVNGAAVGGGGGTSIVNGTSNVNIAAAGSNVTVAVAGSNVATFSTTSLVLGSGSGGNITGVTNVTATNLNGFVYPTAGTTSTPPIDLVAGTLTSSAVAGAIEMDSTSMFITHNTTTGRGEIGRHHQYRITADSAAFGPGITDFFPASSSLNLEASSIYEIDAMVWFLKTTAGTATWTWTFSSAASMARSYYVGTIATGFTTALVTGAPITGYVIQQTSTALAHAATASLTTAVNHHYHFKVHVWTNAATNVRLRLTQSAGTATPRAGSYYAVRKIGANAGVFA